MTRWVTLAIQNRKDPKQSIQVLPVRKPVVARTRNPVRSGEDTTNECDP